MRAQPATAKPVYHIFNMGFSSWGAKVGLCHCLSRCRVCMLTAHAWVCIRRPRCSHCVGY